MFEVFLVELDKLDIKRLLRGFLFIMHYEQMELRRDSEKNEKQTQFCSNLLTSRMRPDVNP